MKESKEKEMKSILGQIPEKEESVKYVIGEVITINTIMEDSLVFGFTGRKAIEGTILKNTKATKIMLHDSGTRGIFNTKKHQYHFEVPEYQMDLGVDQWLGDIMQERKSLSPGDFEIVITNKTKIK